MNSEFEKVVEIIKSDRHDLRGLAELSGRDAFKFYNGADLKSLDLSEQDLCGLNFDGADLRFSNLDAIKFDTGAFNNSIVDASQRFIKDEFIYNAQEVLDFPSKKLLLFARVRPKLIDGIASITGLTYSEFSQYCNVSVNALRKTRTNKVVAMETVQSIFETIMSNRFDLNRKDCEFVQYLISQPCVIFLSGGNNAPFYGMSKEKTLEFIRDSDLTFYSDFSSIL